MIGRTRVRGVSRIYLGFTKAREWRQNVMELCIGIWCVKREDSKDVKAKVAIGVCK